MGTKCQSIAVDSRMVQSQQSCREGYCRNLLSRSAIALNAHAAASKQCSSKNVLDNKIGVHPILNGCQLICLSVCLFGVPLLVVLENRSVGESSAQIQVYRIEVLLEDPRL